MIVTRSQLSLWLLVLTTVSGSSAFDRQRRVVAPTCTIERGVDHFGGDYQQLQLATFDDCLAACQQDPNCVTAQYTVYNNSCYLKNTLNDATPDARVDSAICRSPSGNPAPTTTTMTTSMNTPSTTTTTAANTATTSQATTIGSCSIVWNTDYFGGDYGNMYTPTFEACAQACADASQCVTAQYAKGSSICYLKSVLTTASANTDVDTVICRPPTGTTTTTTTTPIASPTPACAIIRMVDYYGGDYDSFPASSLGECIRACQLDSQCIDTQFHSGYSRCYLKNVLTTPSDNSQVDTAICRSADGGTTSTTSTTTSTTSTTSSTMSTTTTTTTTMTTTTTTRPTTTTTTSPACTNICPAPDSRCAIKGTGFSTNDQVGYSEATPELQDCVAFCQSNNLCMSIVYYAQFGWCYLFSSANPIEPQNESPTGIFTGYDLSCFNTCCGTSTTTAVSSTTTSAVASATTPATTSTTPTTTTTQATTLTTTTTTTTPTTTRTTTTTTRPTTTTTTTAATTTTATQQCSASCPPYYDSYPLVYQGSYSLGNDNRIFCEYGPEGSYTNLCTYHAQGGSQVTDGSDPDCPMTAPCR